MNIDRTVSPSKAGHIHIDRITVNGPLQHDPVGEILYKQDSSVGFVAAGVSAHKPTRRKCRLPDDIYAKSSTVQADGFAYQLLFDCCPAQILQGHNFFGHSDLQSYVYDLFLGQLRRHKLTASAEEHGLWRSGRHISLSLIHLTGNFWIEPHLKKLFIDAIDEANIEGKHRDLETSISLGYSGLRRSNQQGVCVYDKQQVLTKQWTKRGEYQGKLVELADGSIRVEVRLYEGGLAYRQLKSVSAWANVDVDALFFDVLSKFNVGNAIQPLLTEDEKLLLSKPELKNYTLWQAGQDLKSLNSPSTLARHARSIKQKVSVDILSNRRPERLPQLDLGELLSPANIVPLPDWALESGRYWPPRQTTDDSEGAGDV